jgi:hypothetical protein
MTIVDDALVPRASRLVDAEPTTDRPDDGPDLDDAGGAGPAGGRSSQTGGGGGSRPPHPGRRRRRWRRPLAGALLVLLAWASFSYTQALTYPGSAPWGDRTVEWVRSHGGATLVATIEQWYYSRHKPSRGDAQAALGGLAPPGGVVQDGSWPRAVRPAVSPPLPGEGSWHPVGATRGGRATLETTIFRPNAGEPNMVVAAAWMDMRALRATLVAGTVEPGGCCWTWRSEVPSDLMTIDARRPGTFSSAPRRRTRMTLR